MRLGAERHGGDGLHAAEHENLVGAAEVHGGDDRRMRAALERRRAGDDAFDAGDLGGDDRHVRGGNHRITPAGHIAADRIHRDVAVAKHDAGQRLHFEIAHRFFLLLREIAHLRLGELDVLEVAFGHLRDGAFDVLRRQAEILRRPLVEFLRQLADRRVFLALVDLRQDVLDGLAHFGVGGLDRARVHSALEVTGHVQSSYSSEPSSPAKAGGRNDSELSVDCGISVPPGLASLRSVARERRRIEIFT